MSIIKIGDKEFPEYDYSTKGQAATVLPGAYAELVRRNWHKVDNADRDGQSGIVAFHYGPGSPDDHICIEFSDGDAIGVPPDFVRLS
jgi:hypothetical protein